MNKQGVWRKISIFVSSTFLDMNLERDYLHKVVIKNLNDFFSKYKIEINLIDLRWGIFTDGLKDKADKEKKILETCFDEIMRCRPFFIALLGDRYGWVLPKDKIDFIKTKLNNEKDQQLCIKKNPSVTSLEILYGTLANKKSLYRSIFSFRTLVNAEMINPDIAKIYLENEYVVEQQQLKKLILEECKKNKCENRIINYNLTWNELSFDGIKQWGEIIEEKIKDEIIGELGITVKNISNWYELEEHIQDEFIHHNVKNFRGRETILRQLNEFVEQSKNKQFFLNGKLGIGKSSVLAYFYNQKKGTIKKTKFRLFGENNNLERINKEYYLFFSAGLSPNSKTYIKMLQYYSWKISQILNVIYEEVQMVESYEIYEEMIENQFCTLNKRITTQNARLVFIVDAIENLDKTNTLFRKFSFINENILFIFSSTLKFVSIQNINLPSIIIIEIDSISETEAKEILIEYLKEQKKELSLTLIQKILNKKEGDEYAYYLPLWLKLVITILCTLDYSDFEKIYRIKNSDKEKQIENYLYDLINDMPADADKLFIWWLKRFSVDYNYYFTFEILQLIAISKYGLRDNDLRCLLGNDWNELNFSLIKKKLKGFLVEQGEGNVWNITNNILKKALNKYEDQVNRHERLAKHLQKLPDDDLIKTNEIMFHLLEGKLNREASHYLAKVSSLIFNNIATKAANQDIIDFLVNDKNNYYVVSYLVHEELTAQEKYDLLNNLILEISVILENKGYTEIQLSLFKCIHNYVVNFLQNTYLSFEKQSISLQHTKIEIESEMSDFNCKQLLVQFYIIEGNLQKKCGDMELGRNLLMNALNIFKQLKIQEKSGFVGQRILANIFLSLGDFFKLEKLYDDAKIFYKRYYSILYNENFVDLKTHNEISFFEYRHYYERVGSLYEEQGNFHKAIEEYNSLLDICTNLYNQNSQLYKYKIEYVETIIYLLGCKSRANIPIELSEVNRALDLISDVLIVDSDNLRNKFKLAYLYYYKSIYYHDKDQKETERNVLKALSILQEIVNSKHNIDFDEEISGLFSKIGFMMFDMKLYYLAETSFLLFKKITKKLIDREYFDDSNLLNYAIACHNIGMIFYLKGKYTQTLIEYKEYYQYTAQLITRHKNEYLYFQNYLCAIMVYSSIAIKTYSFHEALRVTENIQNEEENINLLHSDECIKFFVRCLLSRGNALAKIVKLSDAKFFWDKALTSLEILNDKESESLKQYIIQKILNTNYDVDYYIDEDGELTLAANITSIHSCKFAYNTHIKSVYIHSGIKTISVEAFKYCIMLEKVEVPKNVKEIKKGAFKKCFSLQKIKFDNGIQKIGDNVFSNCINLREVSIPDTVKVVGKAIFSNCYNLKTLILPNTLSLIPDYMCWKCFELKKLKLGESCKHIGYSAFSFCSKLERVLFKTDILILNEYSFEGCLNVKFINNIDSTSLLKNKFPKAFVNYFETSFFMDNFLSLSFDKKGSNFLIIRKSLFEILFFYRKSLSQFEITIRNILFNSPIIDITANSSNCEVIIDKYFFDNLQRLSENILPFSSIIFRCQDIIVELFFIMNKDNIVIVMSYKNDTEILPVFCILTSYLQGWNIKSINEDLNSDNNNLQDALLQIFKFLLNS